MTSKALNTHDCSECVYCRLNYYCKRVQFTIFMIIVITVTIVELITTAKRVQFTIFMIVVITVTIVNIGVPAMSVQFTIFMIVVNVLVVKKTIDVINVFYITNEFMLNGLAEIKISTV